MERVERETKKSFYNIDRQMKVLLIITWKDQIQASAAQAVSGYPSQLPLPWGKNFEHHG